jgi:hypothetical protein
MINCIIELLATIRWDLPLCIGRGSLSISEPSLRKGLFIMHCFIC